MACNGPTDLSVTYNDPVGVRVAYSPNMTSGLSMGLAVTPCHKIHTMDLHRRLQWPSCTTFSVTVLYPDPLGVRVVYNSSPDISVI